jgi:hypothetical protein
MKGGRKVDRHFQTHLHKKVAWLCGCSEVNKLFFPPRPLFSKEKQTWTSAGSGDLHNLHKAEKLDQCTSTILELRTE